MPTAKKRTAPKTATAKKAAPKKKTKSGAKVSFANVVRRLMSETLPEYRFVSTTGGSGPLVTFERPTAASPNLREQVVFQKGLHGASWFRVNFFPMFEGPTALGTTEHSIYEGETLGADVSWKDDAKLEPLLVSACAKLEGAAKKFFGPFEKKSAKYEALLGALVTHYAAWLDAVGKKLPPEQFQRREGTEPEAFVSFRAWLAKAKLTQGLSGNVDTCLWRFWTGGRPMRESDYEKDRYYDCSQCKAFVRRSRAHLVKHKVAGFGDHYALVCAKH